MIEFKQSYLKDLVEIQRGHDLPQQKRIIGEIPVIGSNGVVGYHNESKGVVPGLTIGRSGSIGNLNFLEKPYFPLNTTLYVTDFKGNDERFVYYLFKNFNFSSFDSGTVQPSLNRNYLYKAQIKYPDVDEQKAIANILGTLDDKIELNQKMNQTLEDIAKAIFKSWFIDFDPVRAKAESKPTGLPQEISDLFPDSFEDSELGDMPDGWRVEKLENIVKIQYGKNLPTNKLTEEGYSVFGGNGIIGSYSKYLYEDAMTLVACRGAASGKVSSSLPQSFVTNNSLVMNHIVTEFPSQKFLEYYLKYIDPVKFTTGSAQPQITIEGIKDCKLLISPNNLIEKYEIFISVFLKKILTNQNEIETLTNLRETLLPKLISGEIRIRDAEKTIGEVL
tara:strand:- start:111 stop:1280 length:1170 start_codon:yes stop_codon:yes gene_type:complete